MSFEQNGRPSLLILTGNLGDGHRQAAYAMAEAAVRMNPETQTHVVDVMERTHPTLHRFSQFCYMQWITKFPWLYGYLFRQTKDNTLISRWLKKLPLCNLNRLQALLEETRPSVVVCTFPAAAAAIAQLKLKRLTSVTAVTVITDHTYHSYWIHPGTDRYIVGSEHIRAALRQWPVPERRIAVTGIPVRGAFGEKQDREELCRRHGLDPSLRTLMIMGGGYGLIGGDWAKLLTAPGLLEKPMQTVIVCGRNEKLQQRLTRELRHYPHKLLITGYVEHVHELMGAADLLITKPGGLTTSEALASGLPMLLYKPLPGQEYDNAAYLTQAGAAIQASNDKEFVGQLKLLLDRPELLERMRDAARELGRRNSAELAVREIMGTAHNAMEPVAVRRALYVETEARR
jgi:processive 1,2-diacylglycerol beta-glucosyltransferase